jgi:hypothetical protein
MKLSQFILLSLFVIAILLSTIVSHSMSRRLLPQAPTPTIAPKPIVGLVWKKDVTHLASDRLCSAKEREGIDCESKDLRCAYPVSGKVQKLICTNP